MSEPATATGTATTAVSEDVRQVVRQYWGFDELRPLQAEAIEASLARRDSLVVMPTGGGKSLCYQVPPMVADRTDVVISPLISLMKDQVDGLRAAGYPAAALHSGLSGSQRQQVERAILAGRVRLVFAAPERVLTSWFLSVLERLNISSIAIDEAHCISQWGHDFRPEYRRLVELRQRFPEASLHAFTATATPQVRADIIAQLKLREPAELVGVFDRPNLVYRVLPKTDQDRQVVSALRRHEGKAGIVYCISRKDTESMAAVLRSNGINAAHYHAGMEQDERRRTQEAFAQEKLDVVAATVAFGMGIDRSDVRCIVHASMPKTIEHYQQETGRAGRDGLPAECVMLYSAGDAMRWEGLIDMSAERAENPEQVSAAQRKLLRAMQKYSRSQVCRHKALSAYFGQDYTKANCGACDVCLDDVDVYDDATILAQKILSCVARTEQRFGIGHVIDVLRGSKTEMIRKCRHDQLSTHGLLADMPKDELKNLVYQLVDQGVLARTDGDRPLLRLNEASWQVMRSERQVHLVKPKSAVTRATAKEAVQANVDEGLYEALRQWRQEAAGQRDIPPYVLVDENTLRELATVRPTKPHTLMLVHGLGVKRRRDFGADICATIRDYCAEYSMKTNLAEEADITRPEKRLSASKQQAFAMFGKGETIERVSDATGRAVRTCTGYLAEYIERKRPKRVDKWIDNETYQRVLGAIGDGDRLKPIFERLNGEVSYDHIHIVVAHQKAMYEAGGGDGGEEE